VISKYNQKTTCKRLSSENLGKRLSIDETALFQWRTLYYFDQQSSKREERNHSSWIAEALQTVIAIIEKYRLNYEIQFLR
jgi:hypothetical protein